MLMADQRVGGLRAWLTLAACSQVWVLGEMAREVIYKDFTCAVVRRPLGKTG